MTEVTYKFKISEYFNLTDNYFLLTTIKCFLLLFKIYLNLFFNS